jgi:hypothetical protein
MKLQLRNGNIARPGQIIADGSVRFLSCNIKLELVVDFAHCQRAAVGTRGNRRALAEPALQTTTPQAGGLLDHAGY